MKLLRLYDYITLVAASLWLISFLMQAGFRNSVQSSEVSPHTLIGSLHHQVFESGILVLWLVLVSLGIVGVLMSLYHFVRYMRSGRSRGRDLAITRYYFYISVLLGLFAYQYFLHESAFHHLILVFEDISITDAGIKGSGLLVAFLVFYSIGYAVLGRLLPLFFGALVLSTFFILPFFILPLLAIVLLPFSAGIVITTILLRYSTSTYIQHDIEPHDTQGSMTKQHLILVGKWFAGIFLIFWLLLGIYAVAQLISPELFDFRKPLSIDVTVSSWSEVS